MPDLLISGPAGAGKSAAARRELAERESLTVAADFQSIFAALTLATRDEQGRYPLRDERLLPIVEYVRRAVISGARSREIGIVATNSDGDPGRRRFLLDQLGPGATERVIDPGEPVIRARLADPETGELSEECDAAALRWYGRLGFG